MATTIWHNPRCSTSRGALELLVARGREPRVRLYLEDAPDAAEIARVLKLMKAAPDAIVRLKDAPTDAAKAWTRAKNDAGKIAALAAHPILIERPIVIAGRKAALIRPKAEAEARLALIGL
jgi:arsenate reductase